MIRGFFEKAGTYLGFIEDTVRDAVHNTDIAREARIRKAVKSLDYNITARKDFDNHTAMSIKTIRTYVPSGHYFNIGQIVLIKSKAEDGIGQLVEYTWMARARVDGTLPRKHPEIIGKKNHRVIPKDQYRDIVKKYFIEEIDTFGTPKTLRASR